MNKLAMSAIWLLALVLVGGTVGCGGDEATPSPTGGVAPSPTVEPITLRLVTSVTEDSAAGQVYNHFADLVREYSGGLAVVDVYPGSQLFPATEQWEAVVTGTVDILADSTYWVSPYVPDVMVFFMDGVWEDYEHAYAALEESELPQVLAEKVAEAGLAKMLGVMPASMAFGTINSDRETQKLKDLDGLRTQSSPGAPPPAICDYTGMSAVPLAYEEYTTAFMQGIVDALQATADEMANLRLHETGKHVLWRYAMFPTVTLIINSDSWEGLPAGIQDVILNEVMPEVYEFDKARFREIEDAAIELIGQNVETVHWVTQEDLDPYLEYLPSHPIYQVQKLMIDPRIVEIVDDIRPSRR
jgi:TRAP-type C4-dicarboxylate transport system substrate-binding protein